MEEKLQKILDDCIDQIDRHKIEENKLLSRIEFCVIHKFDEEERIARIKYNAIHMIIYGWSTMHRQIQELLNKWNS